MRLPTIVWTEHDPPGKWEAVADHDGEMVRVRWSKADAQGRRLYVRHYPGDAWGRAVCERQAAEFNAAGVPPERWDDAPNARSPLP